MESHRDLVLKLHEAIVSLVQEIHGRLPSPQLSADKDSFKGEKKAYLVVRAALKSGGYEFT